MMRRARQLKDHAVEADLFRRRALVGFLLVLLALGGLAAWYFRLQVVQHAEFATRSEANRLRLVPVAPARGLIYDRKGRLLADNVAAWRLDAVPERAGDGEALLAKLRTVVVLDEEQRTRFLRDYRNSRPFKPVTIKLRVSDEEAARWRQIQGDYQRQRQLGGADDDPSVRVTRGLLDISRSVDALQTIAAQSSGAGEKLSEQVARHSLLIGKPLATIARHLSEPAPASAESQALTHLAQQLQDGHAQAQTQLRDALAATTASLKALQNGTQALTQHSDRAQEQRMVDALLSLSVTYRQLIMPLVRAVETRMGEDAQLRQQITQLESQFEQIGKRPD